MSETLLSVWHACAAQGAEPENTVEAAVRCLHAALTSAAAPVGRLVAGARAAEWWAHMRSAQEPHQLHFDLDESRLRAGAAKYKLKHPVRPARSLRSMAACSFNQSMAGSKALQWHRWQHHAQAAGTSRHVMALLAAGKGL